jgi:signal transduction histidine kinase
MRRRTASKRTSRRPLATAARTGAPASKAAMTALDALPAQIAILDGKGRVIAVNKAWREFGMADRAAGDRCAVGDDYVGCCLSIEAGAPHLAELATGVKDVLRGVREEFVIEYPLRSPAKGKWFHARVTRSNGGAVIAHEDISQRVAMERDIVSVGAREQQRMRQELHDGLSQQLTGLKFQASLLEYHLNSKGLPEAAQAKSISELLNQATDEASKLARRFRPVEVDARGLMMALRQLGLDTEHVSKVACVVQIRRAVFIHDNETATNLYRIAEEAVANALQRRARRVNIDLSEDGRLITLKIRDNGRINADTNNQGLGQHLMRYHARMISATLEWQREGSRGLTLTCCVHKTLPVNRQIAE